MEYNRAIGMKFKFALENPRGSLECQEYMQTEELPDGIEKVTFDQCTYGREYKKTTQLWHDLEGYTQTPAVLSAALCKKSVSPAGSPQGRPRIVAMGILAALAPLNERGSLRTPHATRA